MDEGTPLLVLGPSRSTQSKSQQSSRGGASTTTASRTPRPPVAEAGPVSLPRKSCSTPLPLQSPRDHYRVSHASGDETTDIDLEKARRFLYLSHFFAQFSEVAWQFSLILFLAAITRYKSLALVSTYGLASGLSVCAFGSTAGRFVDGANRLASAQFFIWTENLSVLVATAFCYRLLLVAQDDPNAKDPPLSLVFDDSSSSSNASWLESMFPHVPLDPISLVCIAGVHFFGAFAQILDRGFLVAIERDWVVIMSQAAVPPNPTSTGPPLPRADSNAPSPEPPDRTSSAASQEPHQQRHAAKKSWLSETNVCMKQIDLSCKVVAPAVAGLIIGAFDTNQGTMDASASEADTPHYGNNLKGAALLVGVVNVAALVVEYHCTRQVYNMVPGLAFKSDLDGSTSLVRHQDTTVELPSLPSQEVFLTLPRGRTGGGIAERWAIVQETWRLPPALRLYLDQPVSKAGLSLGLLYFNALTFGALMTAYLVWRGMRLETVGLWRGVSSAVGLAGTFVYHCSVRRSTVVTTGMWSICYQLFFISVSFAALFVTDYGASMGLLIVGVCASRIGLWAFDIAVTQLMQEHIPDGIRGVVGGSQEAINAFFQLLSYALGIIFPDPSDFQLCVGAGYAAVVAACVLYGVGVYCRADYFRTISDD